MIKASYATKAMLLFAILVTGGMVHGASCAAGSGVSVEILFMNHGPMQPTIRNLKATLQKFPGKVAATWHDYDTKDGKAFMKRQGVRGHFPCLIYINNSHTFNIEGRPITFKGFPTGAGPYQFQGKWTFQHLERVLASLIR